MIDPTAAAVLRSLAQAERTRPPRFGDDPPARVTAAAPVTTGARVALRTDAPPTRSAADILTAARARDRAAREVRAEAVEAEPISPLVFLEACYMDGLPYRDTNYPWRPGMDHAGDDADEGDGAEDDVPGD